MKWDFIQLSPQFLEAINGILIVVLLSIVTVFAIYTLDCIFKEMRRCRTYWPDDPLRGYLYGLKTGYLQRRAAISCMIFFSGDLLIRIAIWSFRHIQNKGMKPPEKFATMLTTIGVIICIIGGVCILRHFAPRTTLNGFSSYWPIIVMLVSALLFGIGLAI